MVSQATPSVPVTAPAEVSARSTGWREAFLLLARDKVALISLLFLVLLGLAAIFGPMLIGTAATKMNMPARFIPPTLQGGHVFGTDQLGRDVLGRILLASRVSFSTAFIVVGLSLGFGLVWGVLAGFYGGLFDDVVMRCVDVMMGFPSLLLALIVIYALGPSIVNVVLVLAATRWMLYTRVARAETLKLRNFQYVESARCLGGGDAWIMSRHILPNLFNVLATLAALELAVVILAESALSFLGLGIQPPDASLGLLIAQGKEYITSSWWVMFFPGVVIFAATMALSLLAGWLGIALDPVQRWRLTARSRG